jgi:hypothetical protein
MLVLEPSQDLRQEVKLSDGFGVLYHVWPEVDQIVVVLSAHILYFLVCLKVFADKRSGKLGPWQSLFTIREVVVFVVRLDIELLVDEHNVCFPIGWTIMKWRLGMIHLLGCMNDIVSEIFITVRHILIVNQILGLGVPHSASAGVMC